LQPDLWPNPSDLRWHSEDQIPDFIEHAMKVVSDVSGVVDIMKGNLKSISGILSQWCKEPIIERKRGTKPMSMDEFDLKHKERVGMRMMMMSGSRGRFCTAADKAQKCCPSLLSPCCSSPSSWPCTSTRPRGWGSALEEATLPAARGRTHVDLSAPHAAGFLSSCG